MGWLYTIGPLDPSCPARKIQLMCPKFLREQIALTLALFSGR